MLLSSLLLVGAGVAAQEVPDAIDRERQQPAVVRQDNAPEQRVAVVTIKLAGDQNNPTGEVTDIDVLDSPAPKVFARQGGEWIVRLDTGKETSFFVQDPRWFEVEPADDGVRAIAELEIEWRLVVPLYQGDEPLDFERGRVEHARTGDVIAEIDFTPIR